jgi:hypothetical protein
MVMVKSSFFIFYTFTILFEVTFLCFLGKFTYLTTVLFGTLLVTVSFPLSSSGASLGLALGLGDVLGDSETETEIGRAHV